MDLHSHAHKVQYLSTSTLHLKSMNKVTSYWDPGSYDCHVDAPGIQMPKYSTASGEYLPS